MMMFLGFTFSVPEETRTSLDDIDPRVLAGMNLLDDKGPQDWRERVDLERLDISSRHRCVLGQVYGEYSCGALTLFGVGAYTRAESNVFSSGFCSEERYEEQDRDYYHLDSEWKRAISLTS